MSDLKLVHIYTAPDKFTAELIKGFLKDNEIKALVRAGHGPEGTSTGMYGGYVVLGSWSICVLEDKVEEAKKLLVDFEKKDSG